MHPFSFIAAAMVFHLLFATATIREGVLWVEKLFGYCFVGCGVGLLFW